MSQSDDEDRNDDEQQKLPAGEKNAKPQLGDLSAQLFGSSDVNVDENVVQNMIAQNKTLLSGLNEQYKRTVEPDESGTPGGIALTQSAQGKPTVTTPTGSATSAALAPQQPGQNAGPAPAGLPPPPPGSPRASSTSLAALPPPPPGSPRASSTSLAALPPPAWAAGAKSSPPPPPPKPIAIAPSAHAPAPTAPEPGKPAPVPVRPASSASLAAPTAAQNDLANSPFAAQPAGSSEWDNLFARAESALAGFGKADTSSSTPVDPPNAPAPAPAPAVAPPPPTPTSAAPPPPQVKAIAPPVSLTPEPAPEVPETKVPETKAQEIKVPEAKVQEAKVPVPEVIREPEIKALSEVPAFPETATPKEFDASEPASGEVPSPDQSFPESDFSATHDSTQDDAPKLAPTPRAPSQSTNYVDYRLLQELKEEQEEEEDDSDLVYEPLIKPEVKEKKDETKVEVIEEPNELRGMVRRVKRTAAQKNAKPLSTDNKVLKILEKNPLGMTLPEMAGGTRKQSRIKFLRPMLAQAIKEGLVMPVSQRAGHTVYKLVKNISH